MGKIDEQGHCPVHFALSLIGRKWSLPILGTLLARPDPLRFNQLQKAIPGISQRELTKHLRAFEEAGILTRRVYPEVPPRVEYTLTDCGRALCGPITALSDWAQAHGPAMQRNCSRREA